MKEVWIIIADKGLWYIIIGAIGSCVLRMYSSGTKE